VLNGPQGTLFGRNATGGLIRITTRAPEQYFRGEVGLEINNYLRVKAKSFLTGPLSENLGFSLSGLFSKQYEDYGKNLTARNDTYKLDRDIAVRGKLVFTPTDSTTVTLIGDYDDRAEFANTYQPLMGTTHSVPTQGPSTSRYDSYAGIGTMNRSKGGAVSLKIGQDVGFAALVALSACRTTTGTYQIVPTADAAPSLFGDAQDVPSKLYSQQLQLLSKPGPFNWVAGAFYFNNRNPNLTINVNFGGFLSPAPTSPVRASRLEDERSGSIALFGRFNWELAEGTTLTAGARWTYERRDAMFSQVVTLRNGTVRTPPGFSASVTAREPTYRLSLAQEFSPGFMAYALFNTGFKSGGFAITDPANPSHLPEKLKTYEVGFKSPFLDNHVRLNASAYYYDYSNLQVIARLERGTQLALNGAAAELYGLDVDLQAQLADGLQLRRGLALAHSAFLDYPNAVIAVSQPNGANLLTTGSAKGNHVPITQEVPGSLALDYHREVAGAGWDANVTMAYNGKLKQDDYVMLNASLKITLPGDRLSVQVFGRNILDKAILISPATQAFDYSANYAPPRSYGVAVRYDFQMAWGVGHGGRHGLSGVGAASG
jgi:iron complex outermembrane receptor protein